MNWVLQFVFSLKLLLNSFFLVQTDSLVAVTVTRLCEVLFAVLALEGVVVQMNFKVVLKIAAFGETLLAPFEHAQQQLATSLGLLVVQAQFHIVSIILDVADPAVVKAVALWVLPIA
jgi:uncharacterized membrane protein YGL010W